MGLAVYNQTVYNGAFYNEGTTIIPEGVPPDAAIFRVAVGAVPQTYERILADALANANQRQVE